MPGRSYTGNGYRYGYQGSEKDNEVTGINQSHITTYFREGDTRLARWWNADPVFTPWESSYSFMSNNPIFFNDPLGDRIKPADKSVKKDIDYARKHDKEFNKTYKQWQKEYSGRILIIERVMPTQKQELPPNIKVTSLLNGIPQKEGITGNDNDSKQDHIFYDVIGGGLNRDYNVYEVQYTQTFYRKYTGEAGQTSTFEENIASNIPKFELWTLSIAKADNAYPTNNTRIINTSGRNTILKVEFSVRYQSVQYNGSTDADHIFNSSTSGSLTLTLQAVGAPITVKVPKKGRFEYWNKATLDYVLLLGDPTPIKKTREYSSSDGSIKSSEERILPKSYGE